MSIVNGIADLHARDRGPAAGPCPSGTAAAASVVDKLKSFGRAYGSAPARGDGRGRGQDQRRRRAKGVQPAGIARPAKLT